jgi:hypothetical protein
MMAAEVTLEVLSNATIIEKEDGNSLRLKDAAQRRNPPDSTVYFLSFYLLVIVIEGLIIGIVPLQCHPFRR